MTIQAYQDFLRKKAQLSSDFGFEPRDLPGFLFDFQTFLVSWAVRKGRAAMFADCGMGKTPMQLVWADQVVRRENKPVLGLAPLSVSQQTVEEAEKFSIDAKRAMFGGASFGSRVIVTNYERLHHFDPNDFAGVFCDESSIMKNFDGSQKTAITEFMKKIKYRLLCTATAAPNDYIELGTSSEALGYLGYMDMLSMFFKNDEDSLHPAFVGSKWRFKSHAEGDFWRWMASWARACRKPSDLGFDDRHFILPELVENEHVVANEENLTSDGQFSFLPVAARTLGEQREDTKKTIRQRCEVAAALVEHAPSAISWCHLNAEADLLETIIPGARQVKGADPDEKKEELFTGFRCGQIKRLVTKPKIAAFGMNWQHCSDMTYFASHSFEQYYQAVRRCWRFGQKKRVKVDLIASGAQAGVLRNLQIKAAACDEMFSRLVAEMNNALSIDRLRKFSIDEVMPSWL